MGKILFLKGASIIGSLLAVALAVTVGLQIMFCFVTPAAAYKLPDTGSTKCYKAVDPYNEIPCTGEGAGQDGAYTINPPSFGVNGDDTVTDYNTGLMWQQEDDNAIYNWYWATGTYHVSYNKNTRNLCGELGLGGYGDWRLPTRNELVSIGDFSFSYPGPAINQTYFPNTSTWYYWTSTACADTPSWKWIVWYESGAVSDYGGGSPDVYVRCVRGAALPAQSLTSNGNNTVTDSKTGLIWQQAEPGQMNWGAALTYCKQLSLGNSTDWRLPNVKELESLTDYSVYNPSINHTLFPNAHSAFYWSSTPDAYYHDSAWGVRFSTGHVLPDTKNVSNYVRCVSGGGINTCPITAVKVGGSTYATIHEAYSVATDGQSILLQALDFTETNLALNRTIPVTLKGGYDCNFALNSGFATIHGTVTLSSGVVTVENVVVQ
jgi:hypothetical protein